jgi:homoserine O-acetyltransferase
MEEHRDLWWASPTVQLGKVAHLELDAPFRCVHGGELPEIQVSYEEWGTLSPEEDNAVLIIHPMTADCHVTGAYDGQAQGWWEDLVGPGKVIDTDRWYVVCPDLIGGCYGATGPRFPAPDGEPWYDRFPLLTPLDMMRVQRLFLQQALGIERLRYAIGPSMGGMIAWEWAIEASEAVEEVVVVAAPLRTSPHQIGMNWLQRRGIELDIDENEVVAKFGQMVARGVGMLSYRSPTGLEEKFGREWFKPPGSTLKDRGMFNIESWLRFHGKRITKRYDPYTYLLFSRAMDLHDVSRDRDDVMAALDRVSCRVLVMGISTDNLYPPQEVHLGADLLRHLGRDVRYAEIRSLHGHDAFLLETDQIARIIAEAQREQQVVVPSPTERETRVVRLGLLGAGRVAESFARLLERRGPELLRNRGIDVRLQAVSEIDASRELDPVFGDVEVVRDPVRLVEREDVDVVIELTRGTDAHDLVAKALERRRPVVTPNKPLVREHGERLERLAFENGVRIAYHDSIAAGWPLLYALERPLARGALNEIRAILSSSCNVVLQQITRGGTLEEGLRRAEEEELTEVDSALDLSGWDTAQKLTILIARAAHKRYAVDDVPTRGIAGIDPDLVRSVAAADMRVKLVAYAQLGREGIRATVRPMAVPRDSHLGVVRNADNVVVLQNAEEGEMVHLGHGAGTLPVATAVLNDLLGVIDPEESWTGRFPAGAGPLEEPSFERWVSVVDGRAVVGDAETDGAIPLL